MKSFLKYFLLIIFSLLTTNIFSANYYWIGGSGDWTDINHWATSSGGTIKHIQTPTPADNVFLDSNSFTAPNQILNIPIGTIHAHNLDFSGLNKPVTLSGVCNIIKIYGGFKHSLFVTMTFIPRYDFESLHGGNLIYFYGKSVASSEVYFKGSGGSWTVKDSLLCKHLFLERGDLTIESPFMQFGNFVSNTSSPRSIKLTNTIGNIVSWTAIGANFSMNAGTSKLIMTYGILHSNNGSHTFYDVTFTSSAGIANFSGGFTFRDVEFKQNGDLGCNNTFSNLKLTAGYNYNVSPNTIQLFITNLIANGNCKQRIKIFSGQSFATFRKNSGNIQVSYVKLNHIHAIGGATFTAFQSDDLGNNIGWNIQTPLPRNLYWVGGSGVWEDTMRWSLVSGGVGGECIPTQYDNVFLNDLSFPVGAVVLITDTVANCHNMTWNTSKMPVFRKNLGSLLRIFGSLTFCPLMTVDLRDQIHFNASVTGKTITTANHNINSDIVFSGNGSWTLMDSLNIKQMDINIIEGHVITNGKYVQSWNVLAKGSLNKQLTLGSTIWDVRGVSFFVEQDKMIINPGTSLIRFNQYFTTLEFNLSPPCSLYNVLFTNTVHLGEMKTNNTIFHKVTFLSNGLMNGTSVIDSLIFTKGKDYQIDGGITINQSLVANGDCHQLITIRHPLHVYQSTIFKASGNVTVNYCQIRGMIKTGGATFTANNSGDMGFNLGWIFTPAGTNLYWVGGKGHWNDTARWSFTSGGTGGACIPTVNDNVIFNSLSFLNPNDTVFFENTNIFHKNMNWTGAGYSPVFQGSKDSRHFIFGSIDFIQNMKYNHVGGSLFMGKGGQKYIKSAGQDFDSLVFFADSSIWVLVDSMKIKDTLIHLMGKLNLNTNVLVTGTYHAVLPFYKELNIAQSKMLIQASQSCAQSCAFNWHQNNLASITSPNSLIEFKSFKMDLSTSGNLPVAFHNVLFNEGNATISPFVTQQVYFNKCTFLGNGSMLKVNHYDSLIFTKKGYYMMEANFDKYVYKYWKAEGDCHNPITLVSFGSGQANVNKPIGPVQLKYVRIKDNRINGMGPFVIQNGTDLGNNTNWSISPIAGRTLYWVNGTGLWSDSAHWSLTSGGTAGECIPTEIDDVFFDNNSFNVSKDSVVLNGNPVCHNMSWIHLVDTPFFRGLYMNIYGSLLLRKNMQVNVDNFSFSASDTGNTITSAVHNLKRVDFMGRGSWMLLDSLNVFGGEINHVSGTLNANNQWIRTKLFNCNSNSAKKLKLGNSQFMIDLTANFESDSLVLEAGKSTFIYPETSVPVPYTLSFKGKKTLKFHNVFFNQDMKGLSTITNSGTPVNSFNKMYLANDGTFIGEYIFDSLYFTAGNTYKLDKGKTQRINNYWFIRGNNCYAINLQSTLKDNQAYVVKSTGSVNGDFINMRDIHASTGAIFYAGQFSTDIQNNLNWIFSNGPQYIYGLGKDTSFAIGSYIVLLTTNFNGNSATTYLWSDGSTGDSLMVNKSGWYKVTVTYAVNCKVVDSIWVGCRIPLKYQVQNAICYGDSNGWAKVLPTDTNYQYTYVWNTGALIDKIVMQPSGMYYITVTVDSLCSNRDSVFIGQPPPIILPLTDTAFCFGDSLLLDAGFGFKSYNWSDGFSGQSRWVAIPGTFIVFVEDTAGCKSSPDTINITEQPKPMVSLGTDKCLSQYIPIYLTPGASFDSYLWSDLSTFSDLHVDKIGIYWVLVKKGVCFVSDTINIKPCPPELKIPNVFTPNYDGYNDRFVILTKNISKLNLKIFNRWGAMIFETNDPETGWDGNIKGNKASDGTYFFVIEYEEFSGLDNNPKLYAKGSVTLLR